jgi:hypothetical protein
LGLLEVGVEKLKAESLSADKVDSKPEAEREKGGREKLKVLDCIISFKVEYFNFAYPQPILCP